MNLYVSLKHGKIASAKRTAIFLLVFGLSAGRAVAAELPKVSASAAPTSVTPGQELQLAVDFDRPDGYTVDALSRDVKLAPFEVKSIRKEKLERGGRTIERTVFTLAVFEMGDLLIPAVTVQFRDATGRVYQRFTDPVAVKVVGVKKKPSDKDDIRTIKPPVAFSKLLPWTLLGGLLVFFLVATLALKIILRLQKEGFDPEALKPAGERVAIEWKRLKARSLLDEGKVKEFYSELSFILKRYLDRRYGADILELTTQEVLQFTRQLELLQDVVQRIRHVLESSDLVKFAKQVPDRALGDALAAEIIEVTERTKPEPDEKEESGKK
jgi:hypothetical protein